MTASRDHDLHMARLRIARLEEALREAAHRLDMHAVMVESPPMRARIFGWADEARAALTQLASSPRPETEKEPRADEGQTRG